jgi:hypothetical protein
VFFSRAAVGDMGAGKIFRASRESQADTWSDPAEVPYPVNYGGDRVDLAPRLSFDGTELYFASSRQTLFPRPFLDLNVAIRSKLKGR